MHLFGPEGFKIYHTMEFRVAYRQVRFKEKASGKRNGDTGKGKEMEVKMENRKMGRWSQV